MKVLFWWMKVGHCNFATSKPTKNHIEMKKFFSLILVMIAFSLPLVAQGSSGASSTTRVELEVQRKNNSTPVVHRAPMSINIEVYYEEESGTLNICYDGESTGEIFLYLNDTVIGYDSDINTIFQISNSGLYKIEIISETWIATGYLYN